MFAAALAILAATPLVFAGPINSTITIRTCGSHVSEERLLAYEAHFAANRVSGKFSEAAAASIPIYFHVISSGNSVDEGNVP
jgi:hypothetical protein